MIDRIAQTRLDKMEKLFSGFGVQVKRWRVLDRLFDQQWYLENNPDVLALNMNPRRHYLENGGFEGRDPNLFFDSDWYLAHNQAAASSGINPLLHYIRTGAAEYS